MGLRLRIWLLLCCLPAFGQAPTRVVSTLSSLADMYPGTTQPHVLVQGYSSAGDWGPAKTFRWVPSSTASTNAIVRGTRTGVGRWVHDWDGDVRAFGAIPYQPRYTLVPWGYKTNIDAIGTSDFSVWSQFKIPAGGFTNPVGLFTIGPTTRDTNLATGFLLSSIGFRASDSAFGILFRSTTASSSLAGTTTNDAAALDTSPTTFSNLYGTTVDLVFTRSGTNAKIYLNGVDRTSSFSNYNALGWSKPVGTGVKLLASSGNSENMWYWSDPIYRFAIWTNALSGAQAAAPAATSGKIVDFTATDTATPVDSGPGINAALTELAARGGGEANLGRGTYRISTPIRMKRNATLAGSGNAYYPNVTTFVEGNAPAGTTLARWFDLEDDTIQIRRDDFDETFMTLRQANGVSSFTNSTAWVRTASARVVLRDFGIVGMLNQYGAGRGIWTDRVGSVDIRNVGFVWVPGYAVYSVQANALNISQCSGSAGKGFHIRGIADGEFISNFYDGAMGPAMWVVGNLNNITASVAEYSVTPRGGASSWEKVTTVNPTNDTFTVSGRHKWLTGDVIRFVADDTNSLPTPLLEDVDYFVYRVDASNYKVSLKYADEIGKDGVLDGAGFVDITSSGVGTWYGGPGPSCGFLVQGDNNGIVNVRSASNYEDGLRLENARDNRIVSSRFLLAGNGNTNLTQIAGIKLLGASTDNSIIGCSFDTRNTSGYSLIGILGDSTSTKNSIVGNSWQDTQSGWVPTSIAADNYYLDGRQLKIFPIDSANKSTILIPRIAGFTPYAEAAATNSTYIVYDSSGRRFHVARDTSSSNGDYMPTFPYAGPIFWNSLTANAAMQGVNGGAAATMWYLRGEGFNPMVSVQGWSTNLLSRGTIPLIGLQRNNSTSSSTYGVISNGMYLGGLTVGGFFSNTVNHGTYSDAGIYAKATEDWATGKRGTQLELTATKIGTTTLSIGMLVKPNGTINLPYQTAAPTNDVSDGDMFYGVDSGTTNLWVRRAGAWVGALP